MGRLTQFLEAAGTACKKTSRRLSMPLILGLGMLGAMTAKAQSAETPKKADNRASVFYRHKIISPEIAPAEMGFRAYGILANSKFPEPKILNEVSDVLNYDWIGYQTGYQKEPMSEFPVVTRDQGITTSTIPVTNKKTQEEKPERISKTALIDPQNNISITYNSDKREYGFLKGNTLIGEAKMSRYYGRNHDDLENNPYALAEFYQKAVEHGGLSEKMKKDWKTAAFWLQPRHALSFSYGFNKSSSPYYDGPYFKYAAQFGIGPPHIAKNLHIETGYRTFSNDPNKWGSSGTFHGPGTAGFWTGSTTPGNAEIMLGIETGPQSPVIAGIKGGFTVPFSSYNNYLNFANPMAEVRAGVRLNPTKTIGLELTANASAVVVNQQFNSFMGGSGPIIHTTGFEARLTIRPANFAINNVLWGNKHRRQPR